MTKFISLSLAVLLLLGVTSVHVSASPEMKNQVAESITVIEIKDNVAFDDKEASDLLKDLGEDISEVVYTLDCGDRTLTIGYMPGTEDFDYEDMSDSVARMLETMLEDIGEQNNVDYSNYDVKDLRMSEVQLTSDKINYGLLKNEYSDTVETSYVSSQPEQAIENSAKAMATSSNSITGSYHYRDYISDHTSILRWFDQTTNTSSACNITAASPHGGDGNNRYRKGAGYKWYPTNLKTYFRNNSSAGKNKCRLIYSYSPTQLSYLQKDNNEALELSIVFYNYTNYGCAYMKHEKVTYGTDQPTGYLDTALSDSSSEVDFCVGVRDANQLKSNTDYYWWIESTAGTRPSNYTGNGKFKVLAQRSYRVSDIGVSSLIVFSEEHEKILKLREFNTGSTAWDLGSSGAAWQFNAATSPVTWVD